MYQVLYSAQGPSSEEGREVWRAYGIGGIISSSEYLEEGCV